MSDAPEIRPAAAGDAAVVHRIVRDAWTGTVDPRSSGHRLTLADVEQHFTAAAASGDAGGYLGLASPGGDPCASVLWARTDDAGGTFEIMKLAVLPPARKLGFGPALVRAVERHAARAGAARTLLAVSTYSPALVGWYESLGYRVDPAGVYAHASPTSPPPFVLTKPC